MTMHEIDQRFAEAVRELRTDHGISQVGLASALAERGLRLDGVAVLRIEKSKRVIRLSEAVVIADVLGSSVAEMLALAATKKERRIAALRAELSVLEGEA